MRMKGEPKLKRDGVISREAINRLAFRDDVCSNCGADATKNVGGYMVCASLRCLAITRRVVYERFRRKGGKVIEE